VGKNYGRRFLGDLDAATDQDFQSHFVESDDLKRILTKKSDVIYGSKGVGKTALCRALAEINKGSFYATKIVDLQQISFRAVHNALSKLKDTTQTEVPTLARKTWRNVLAKYCLEAVAAELPSSDPLRNQIGVLLENEGFSGSSSNSRLMGQIERFLIGIAEAGLEETAPTPLGLSGKQREVVNTFPSSADVQAALIEASRIVEESGQYVLICLDGFDSIVDHTPESRRAIFAGLIDAIQKSSQDPLLARAFCFKAFLPQELADDAHDILWDSDKHIFNTHYLRWAESDFQSFLKKRLLVYSRSKSNQFIDVWHEYMPDKVRNDIHNLEEQSFSYILRHTLYRPRQVLAHLQMVLDKWDETSDSFRVDPSFIPQVIASNNYTMAKQVAFQLEKRHPGLSTFLQSWSGRPMTVSVGEFQDRMLRLLSYLTPQDINSVFDDFFNFGIFGIASKVSPIKGADQTCFRFGYVGDRFARNINTSVDENDLLALSPMFREYCGCTASEYGIVVPVET
jgi:hypothetical protein